MLYLVGLGLSDETDITVKGLEVVKKASRVYLEAYTSILLVDQPVLVRMQYNMFVSSADKNRKNIMNAQLPSPIAKWSNPTAMRSYATRKRRMLPSL